MHTIALLALGAAMLAAPALAQTAREADDPKPSSTEIMRSRVVPSSPSPGVPIDRGPDTPEANSAHRGGGVVLEGAPGAPAPAPQPTPPSDVSRNMPQGR